MQVDILEFKQPEGTGDITPVKPKQTKTDKERQEHRARLAKAMQGIHDCTDALLKNSRS